MTAPSLDVPLLRAFVTVAEQSGFTSAGDILGATQSAVSLRIRKLEERIGRRLFERSPQSVRLTRFGAEFLLDARQILSAHDKVAHRLSAHGAPVTVSLAISDHAAGARLPEILGFLARRHPGILLTVAVGLSSTIEDAAADVTILRRLSQDQRGDPVFSDRLVWAAAPDLDWSPGDPVPLVALDAACLVRAAAVAALEAAERPWREAFRGAGVAAVQAAAAAGLGIACLDRRNMPTSCIELGAESRLPDLPSSEFLVQWRNPRPDLADFALSLKAAFAGPVALS